MWANVTKLDNDKSLEFATAVIEPILDIAADDKAADIFYTHDLPDGVDSEEYTADCMRKSIPELIKHHQDSLIAIFAANQGITVDEYKGNTNIIQFSADIASMISDPGMRLFFGFAQPRRKPFGSAQENTGE